jgi:O-antigen/teichoic acid export membrane protein
LGRTGLQFIQFAILARLLTPDDFGLIAVVMAVMALAQIFSDMGISNAIIHKQHISREVLSSLYWLNVMTGAVLMFSMIALSPFVASFYNEPRVQPVLAVTSVVFVLNAIGQQLRVIAEKELRFGPLTKLEFVSTALGFITAVVIALIGGGVYALVAGALVRALAASGIAWLWLALGWRPLWRIRINEIREFIGFGAYMIGNNLLNAVNTQADVLLGGRALSAGALGFYVLPRDLGLRIAGAINPIVTRVGLPVMSKLQADRDRLKSVYLQTLRMTASVNFPIYLALAVFAPEVVSLLFGSKWQESVPLLRILALWGLIRSAGNPAGGLLMAIGKAKLSFLWNLGVAAAVLPALWIGLRYGTQGLALALLSIQFVLIIPIWLVLVKPSCGAGFLEYHKQLIIPLWIATGTAAVAYIAALPFELNYARLLAGMLAGGIVYFLLSKWFNKAWFEAMRQLMFRAGAQ